MPRIAFCASPFTPARTSVGKALKCHRRLSTIRASAVAPSTSTPASTASSDEITATTTAVTVDESAVLVPADDDSSFDFGAITSLSEVNDIVQLADEFDLADLRIASGGISVEITRDGGRGFVDGVLREPPAPVAASVQVAETVGAIPQAPYVDANIGLAEELLEDESSETTVEALESSSLDSNSSNGSDPDVVYDSDFVVKSNRVGFFFSGAQNKPPLVNVGDHVGFNQPVCIIEQLGQQYVYLSEVSGTVTKIFVEDGDAVQFDDQVMVIRPD